jgi:WD40 repeat protein
MDQGDWAAAKTTLSQVVSRRPEYQRDGCLAVELLATAVKRASKAEERRPISSAEVSRSKTQSRRRRLAGIVRRWWRVPLMILVCTLLLPLMFPVRLSPGLTSLLVPGLVKLLVASLKAIMIVGGTLLLVLILDAGRRQRWIVATLFLANALLWFFMALDPLRYAASSSPVYWLTILMTLTSMVWAIIVALTKSGTVPGSAITTGQQPLPNWAAILAPSAILLVSVGVIAFAIGIGPSRPEPLQTLGHQARVSTAAFNPSGDRLLAGGQDVLLWDFASHEEVAFIEKPSLGPSLQDAPLVYYFSLLFDHPASFNSDGSLFMTRDGDLNTLVWDSETGQILYERTGNNATFSPDGSLMATMNMSGTLWIWDSGSGARLNTLQRPSEGFYRATFSPDNDLLVAIAISDAFGAIMWDLETGAVVNEFEGVTRAIFSPDGTRIITLDLDDNLQIWNVHTGQEMASYPNQSQPIFSPDGRLILSVENEFALLLDAETGERVDDLWGHKDEILRAVFSPSGRYIATASKDGTARLWNVETAESIHVLRVQYGQIGTIAFSPDEALLVTGSSDATARVWDVSTGRQLAILSGHSRSPLVEFNPDNRHFITAGGVLPTGCYSSSCEEGAVIIWSTDDLDSGRF